MRIDVLCALDPAWPGRELKSRLEPSNVILAASAREVEAALRVRTPDMVIVESHIPPPPIEDWIRQVCGLPGRPDVVLVHDRDDASFRAAAIRAGCLAVLGSALTLDELIGTIMALIERRLDLLRRVQARLTPKEIRLRDFVAHSPRMREFLTLAGRVVGSGSSLLVLGETGTGKERLARAMHAEGPRHLGPFVAVNCGALPESLLESELFGHEKGAFTGASRARRGYFEQADGGTLLLDEIGELPLHLQVKLLRVLDARQVQRLGAERPIPVDVRLVAATHRDLEKEVSAGRFREDLFYRLAVVTLTMPALRERVEDIPTLFEDYLDYYRANLSRPILGVEDAVLEALVRYRWPGNVRELMNVVEHAVLLAPGPEIGLADLPRAIASQAPVAAAPPPLASAPPGEAPPAWLGMLLRDARQQVVGDFERRYLSHLLRETRGRIGEAARRAGINERSLYELMRRHQLRKEDFRAGRSGGE